MQLPTDNWLRTAGSLLAIYSAATGSFCGALPLALTDPYKETTDWALPLVFALTAIVLLPGACLLYARRSGLLKVAALLLLIGGVGVASEVVIVIIDGQRPGGAVGKALVDVPAILIAVTVFCIIIFALARLAVLIARSKAGGQP